MKKLSENRIGVYIVLIMGIFAIIGMAVYVSPIFADTSIKGGTGRDAPIIKFGGNSELVRELVELKIEIHRIRVTETDDGSWSDIHCLTQLEEGGETIFAILRTKDVKIHGFLTQAWASDRNVIVKGYKIPAPQGWSWSRVVITPDQYYEIKQVELARR